MTQGLLTAQFTGEDRVDLEPPRATLGQARLALTNRGQLIRVEEDVYDVARHLKSIDPGLHLEFDKKQGIYILFWTGMRLVDGIGNVVEDFVGAYTELDSRLINLIERIDAQGRGRVDLQRELDNLERQKDAEHEWAIAQQQGAAAEELRHAIRRDLNLEGSSVQMSTSRGGLKQRKEKRRQQKAARRAGRRR